MKGVKFLDSVLNKKCRYSTPLEKVTLIPLDFNLDLIKDSYNYGIMVPSLMGIIFTWSRLQYTRAYAHSPVRWLTIGKLTIYLLVTNGILYQVDQQTHDTNRKARLVIVKWCLTGCMMEKQTVHSFYSAVKFGLKSVDNWTLRITGFRFKSTKYHYMMLWSVCGVLWVQLRLLVGSIFFFENINSHQL